MQIPDLTARRREPEWMDAPDADPAELIRALGFLRRINCLLGYSRQTLAHLERFSCNWSPGQPIRIIDFATGSADIPRAILRWATERGFDVRIVGVDLHATTAAAAREESNDARLSIVRCDVLDLPFEAGAFDYAITSLFLHHLDDDTVVKVLAAMDRISSRGIVVCDLLRHKRAYVWISLFTLFAGPMVRHDARVSVAQSFLPHEVLHLRDLAAMSYARYFTAFGHRFALAGEKKSACPA